MVEEQELPQAIIVDEVTYCDAKSWEVVLSRLKPVKGLQKIAYSTPQQPSAFKRVLEEVKQDKED